MKRLGGIILPEQTQWTNRYSETPVVSSMRFTVSGVPVIQETALQGGVAVVIEFVDGIEWIEAGLVKQIKMLEAQLGVSHEFEFEGEIMRVVFNRQLPCNFAQVWPGSTWYTGQINLIKI